MNEITQIVDCFLPNLAAGKYTVEVSQKVKNKDKIVQEVAKQMYFGIDAARFTLNTDDIYSVYPPANTVGQYKNHFPHIVFNRRTLPWERTIDGCAREENSTKHIPWMTILLFDEEEMKSIKIETTDLKEILYQENPADTISRPKIWDKSKQNEELKLMEWEDINQKCLTIDITKKQFIQYIPKLNELPYIAHSKIVTIKHKDTNGIGDTEDDKGYFSTLLCNRFVKENKAYTAIVISLEGHQEYINDNTLLNNQVRMVVLASWKFNSDGQNSFETLLNEVEVHTMSLEHTSKKSNELDKYLKYGYLPMRHLMRNGARNISWYRGPFVPNNTSFDTKNNIKFSSSDTALYYDTNTGLLDVSIAAAWELGKIMALKNQEFTKAMIEWNNNPYLNDNDGKTKLPNKTDILNWIQNIEKSETDLKEQNAFQSYKPFPEVVKVFLRELAELKGVPISYLIPDKKYITAASGNENCITLFQVNPKWIFALLDGAVSLTGLRLIDTKTQVEGIIESVYGNTKCTGFLLHSKLVSGWRGIEIKAFNKDKIVLENPVRFERITPSIFLGIFKDDINSICIKQPYEGLHFGIKDKDSSSSTFEKALKNASGKINENNKIEINTNAILKDNQVISIEVLTELVKLQTQASNFTTADFAYQMIDSPMEGFFAINFTS